MRSWALNIYAGKKINVALVANLISKEQHLTDECAAICAKTFEASLRFAGMISADGIVELSGSPTAQEKKVDPNTSGASVTNTNSFGPSDQDESGDTRNTHRHVLFLDRNKSRQFAFSGPLEITQAEFERICKWLEFTMLIVSETKEVNHERPNNGARDGE